MTRSHRCPPLLPIPTTEHASQVTSQTWRAGHERSTVYRIGSPESSSQRSAALADRRRRAICSGRSKIGSWSARTGSARARIMDFSSSSRVRAGGAVCLSDSHPVTAWVIAQCTSTSDPLVIDPVNRCTGISHVREHRRCPSVVGRCISAISKRGHGIYWSRYNTGRACRCMNA